MVSSVGLERYLDTVEVAGSNPVPPTRAKAPQSRRLLKVLEGLSPSSLERRGFQNFQPLLPSSAGPWPSNILDHEAATRRTSNPLLKSPVYASPSSLERRGFQNFQPLLPSSAGPWPSNILDHEAATRRTSNFLRIDPEVSGLRTAAQ